MRPKEKDPERFREQAQPVCDIYAQAAELHANGTRIISTDEKTGIQARERISPAIPVHAGQPERQEYEYKRHGTLCLIANFEVATGRVVALTIGPTRTEADFVGHIAKPDPGGVHTYQPSAKRWVRCTPKWSPVGA